MQKRGSDPASLEDLQAMVAALATLTVDLTRVVHGLNPDPVDRMLRSSRAQLRRMRNQTARRPSNAEMEIAFRRVELLQLAIQPSAAARNSQQPEVA